MKIEVVKYKRRRYLAKTKGKWYLASYHTTDHPEWFLEVTDVIWLRSDNMIANWRLKENGKIVRNKLMHDSELTEYLLQAEEI
jgi:hypothetical protein